MPRPSDVQQPDLIADRYQCVRLLGRGGFAEVYLAEDLRLDKRHVAVKVLAPHVGRDEGKLKKFRQEAAIIGHLTNSNTVRCYDFGQDRYGRYYLVMEYLAGKTLHRLLKEEKTLDIQRSLRIAIQVLDALEEAHQMGIIHRDLKPKNIILVPHRKGERVKVLDFGVARILMPSREPDEDEWTMVGTATYMSPEQAQGTAVSPASDLYSLGVILYHALTGRPPFVSKHDPVALMLHHTSSPVESMLEFSLPHEISFALNKAVLKSLEKSPTHRYKQASHFREVLEELLRKEEDPYSLESVQSLPGEEEWPTSVALMSQDLNSEELPDDSYTAALAAVRAKIHEDDPSEELPQTSQPERSPATEGQTSGEVEPAPPRVNAFSERSSVEEDVEEAMVQWLSIAPEESVAEEEGLEEGHTLDTRPRHEKPEEKTKSTRGLEYSNYTAERPSPRRGELAQTDREDSSRFASPSGEASSSREGHPLPVEKKPPPDEPNSDAGKEPPPSPSPQKLPPRPSENTRERMLLDNLLESDSVVSESRLSPTYPAELEDEEPHTQDLRAGLSSLEAQKGGPNEPLSEDGLSSTRELSPEQVSAAFSELASTVEEDQSSWEQASKNHQSLFDTARDSLSITSPIAEGATTLRDEDGWKQRDYTPAGKTGKAEAPATTPKASSELRQKPLTTAKPNPPPRDPAQFEDSTTIDEPDHDLEETSPSLHAKEALEQTASRTPPFSWESPSPKTLRMDLSETPFGKATPEKTLEDWSHEQEELSTPPTVPRSPIPPPSTPHPSGRKPSRRMQTFARARAKHGGLHKALSLLWEWKWVVVGASLVGLLALLWVVQYLVGSS